MYKTYVPLKIKLADINEMEYYASLLKRAKVDVIFFNGIEFIYDNNPLIEADPMKIKNCIDFFKDKGFTVGVWFSGLGHGCHFPDEGDRDCVDSYTKLKGINGAEAIQGMCPLDETFRETYRKRIKLFAELNPDIIHINDDFRLNSRPGVVLACFCDKHLEDYYNRIGERLPLEEIKKRILSGGKSKYRSAYLEMCKDTLLDFAKYLREAVDEVNPDIRLSSCGTMENWDASGTDMIEIVKAFAGKTKPFLRTNAGPYWHNGTTYKVLADTIEYTRMQAAWCKGHDIEVFAEGDPCPRPRYLVSANLLELFDVALLASNCLDGNMKYMLTNPSRTTDYETGYTDRHIKNEPLRNELSEIFNGKTPVGPRVVCHMHIVENMDIPEEYENKLTSLKSEYRQLSLLSTNSIPTAFEDTGYPALIVGENAKYVTKEDLKNGAILDIPAAKILEERGFDTGLLSAKRTSATKEHYLKYNDLVFGTDTGALYDISVKYEAEILSIIEPSHSPSGYIYNNFYVLATDLTYGNTHQSNYSKKFLFDYYRQADLIYAIEKISGKKLPAVLRKAPFLYTLTAKDSSSMSVILCNIFEDDISNGEIELDKEYKDARFINCTGTLKGNKLIIDQIHPYSFAAFEVK